VAKSKTKQMTGEKCWRLKNVKICASKKKPAGRKSKRAKNGLYYYTKS
jgi:hypothetical protein